MTRICYALIFAFLTSCSSGDKTQTHSFWIHEEDGVTIAETTGGPKYEGELFKYEEVLELQEDEREESLLYRPSDFFMDEACMYYVCDSGNYRIAVFDQQGRFIYGIGRRGEGPGEFQRGFKITEIQDGIISVYDRALRRITEFDTKGHLLGTLSIPSNASPYIHTAYYLGDDRFLSFVKTQNFEATRALEQEFAVCLTADCDTLWIGATSQEETYYSIREGRSVVFIGLPPIGPSPSSFYKSSWGFALITGKQPNLDVFGVDGTRRLQIRLNIPQKKVTHNDRVSEERWYDQLILQAEGSRKELYKKRRQHFMLPDNWSFWRGLEVDDAGFHWLEVPEHKLQRREAGDGVLYRVLSPEGEYLGFSRRPSAISSRICHGHLLSLETATGSYRLKVYRTRPVVEGLEYP